MKCNMVKAVMVLAITLIAHPVYSACDTGCISVGNDLKLNICTEYQGVRYATVFDFSPGTDGLWWKLDVPNFKPTSDSSCIRVENDLALNFCCAAYQGVNYKFTLNYTPYPAYPTGYYWKMDMATLSVADQPIAAKPSSEQQKFQDMLDKAVSESKTQTPGAVLLVSTPSAQYVIASGKSDLSSNTAMKTSDMLRIASMTKTFLATVVLKLNEEGKLNLDDTIDKYIPDTAAKIANGQSATIRHLLSMTSGIYEYYDNPDYMTAVESRPARQAWTAEEILSYIYGQKAYFDPGTNFKYTNSNSLLLEMIVNKVSNSTLAAEMRRIIFTPLGMDNTFMEMKEPRSGGFGGLLVRGYNTQQTPPKDITEQNDAFGLGDGGLISDAQGLAKFLRAMFKDKTILKDSSLTQMKIEGIAGKEYGLGLEVRNSATYGINWGHSGKTAGFQGEMRYFPDKDMVFVILTNEENSNSDISETVFKESMSLSYPPT